MFYNRVRYSGVTIGLIAEMELKIETSSHSTNNIFVWNALQENMLYFSIILYCLVLLDMEIGEYT
jgi:hypothetical protein